MQTLRAGGGNRQRRGWALVSTLLLGVLCCSAEPADAATITVDTTVDDTAINGNCTLREAVIAANTDGAVDACASGSGADDIVIPAGTYVLTIVGAGEDAAATGDLDIIDDVDITGDGQALSIIDGNDTDRVLDVDPAATGVAANIAAVTVTNGRAAAGGGGGIRNQGALTIDESTVLGNEALPDDPIGGGIRSDLGGSSLAISNSTVSINTAGARQMGEPPGRGGGIATQNLTLLNSTVAFNIAYEMPSFPPMTQFGFGGGIRLLDGTGIITNSTISGNSAGIGFGDGIDASGSSLTLQNCTISHNMGNGVFVFDADLATVTLRNTILANNSNGDCWVFGGVSFFPFPSTANAYNLDSDNTCSLSGTDLPGIDPLLDAALEDNGGPTRTHALLPGSPAINAGNPASPGSGGAACEVSDQRGISRPQGTRCDIGAYESPCGDGAIQPDEQCDDTELPSDCCAACAFEPNGTSCDDGGACTADDQCTDGTCGGTPFCPADHYMCYQGKDLKQPKFERAAVTLSDQIIANEMVEVQKLKYVCTPVNKAGEGIRDAEAHLTCYQIKAPNLLVRPQLLVSTQFQESRFEAKKGKLLCMPSTKTLVP